MTNLKTQHKQEKEMIETHNQKYKITDIAHSTYSFLHRIRALQDIGTQVKAGDLGGFVESESNLSYATNDCAWIFNDAIAAGNSYVDQNSSLSDNVIICNGAYVSHGSSLSGNARAEDNAYLRGAVMTDNARASGFAQVVRTPSMIGGPLLSGDCQVYGIVRGSVRIDGHMIILPGEEVLNDMKDITFCLSEHGRSILRSKSKDVLTPIREPSATKETPKKRGLVR